MHAERQAPQHVIEEPHRVSWLHASYTLSIRIRVAEAVDRRHGDRELVKAPEVVGDSPGAEALLLPQIR